MSQITTQPSSPVPDNQDKNKSITATDTTSRPDTPNSFSDLIGKLDDKVFGDLAPTSTSSPLLGNDTSSMSAARFSPLNLDFLDPTDKRSVNFHREGLY